MIRPATCSCAAPAWRRGPSARGVEVGSRRSAAGVALLEVVGDDLQELRDVQGLGQVGGSPELSDAF